MKHFYSLISRTFIVAAGLLAGSQAGAQNETSVAPGNCPAVTQNFNNGTGGFTSPSVYGNVTFDSAFYYNIAPRGLWTELGSQLSRGGNGVGPLAPRVVTIVSPPYENPNPAGIFDVGFFYIVPNAAVDRFNISLIRLTTMPSPGGDITYQELVARSGFQTFASFSAHPPMPYVDPRGGNFALTHRGDSSVVCIRLIDPDITEGPNVTYRVEVTYQILTPGSYSDFDDFAIGQISAAPLPVSFLGIVANRKDNGVHVKWDVAEEIDVREYHLEKSTNGSTFSTVGVVGAQGKSLYSYTDPVSKSGVVFYRVKSVDIDGRTKYSGIVKLNGENSYSGGIKVYPSPATNDITVQHSQLGNGAVITLSAADGRVLKTIRPTRGASNSMIDISSFSRGMYIIRLDDGNGKTETTSFIKQ
jgi:hypothetical protein